MGYRYSCVCVCLKPLGPSPGPQCVGVPMRDTVVGTYHTGHLSHYTAIESPARGPGSNTYIIAHTATRLGRLETQTKVRDAPGHKRYYLKYTHNRYYQQTK